MADFICIKTNGAGLYEFTPDVIHYVETRDVRSGVLTLFCRHTSCSLLIQENADPDVQVDLRGFFRRLVPDGDDPSMRWLRHTLEGPDDMPAHIKGALLPVSLSIPIHEGQLTLGTWQGIYLFEHRDQAQSRQIALHLSF